MDIVLGLQRTKRGRYNIFVVVDQFSNICHFIPCNKCGDASNITSFFVENIMKFHGIPQTIVVIDRDPKFLSNFWKELWGRLGTKFFSSTSFHP